VTPGMLFFADAVKVEVSGLLGEVHVEVPAVEHEHGADSLVYVGALCSGLRSPRRYGVLQESDLALERVELAPAPSPAAAQP
jgi:hypothetical protein